MTQQKTSELKKETESLYQFCKNNKEAVDRLNKIDELIRQSLSSQREDEIKFLKDLEEYDTLDGTARIRVDERLKELK